MKKRTKRPQPRAVKRTLSDLPARLRLLREKRDVSQRELAELLQIDVMQISRYERGLSVPSAETLVRMAQMLQTTIDELLTGLSTSAKTPEIHDIRLLDRLRALDQMSKDEREVALQVIDAIIYKSRATEMLREPVGARR